MSRINGLTELNFGNGAIDTSDGTVVRYFDGTTTEELATSNVYTLAGVTNKDSDLGTFTGTTIADNDDIKGALQSLETAVEAASVPATMVEMEYASFNYNDGTVTVASSIPANAWITEIRLFMSTAFDGSGGALNLGNTTDGGSFVFPTGAFDPTDATAPQTALIMAQPTAAENLVLTVTQGTATQGAGDIIVTYIQ